MVYYSMGGAIKNMSSSYGLSKIIQENILAIFGSGNLLINPLTMQCPLCGVQYNTIQYKKDVYTGYPLPQCGY